MPDSSNSLSIASALYKLLSAGVKDVLPTGAGPIVSRNLGIPQDPEYTNKLTNLGLAGLTVYHGSPHKFDKFDSSKIGTGEGVQAYGHGLYMAENPSVAKSYQNDTAIKDPIERMAVNMYQNRLGAKLSPDEAMKQTIEWASKNPQIGPEKAQQAANSIRNAGATYKVDLPDEHIAKMLDWDKPLSQQPEVVKRLQSLPEFRGRIDPADNLVTGQHILAELSNKKGGADKASAYLRDAGIPGIKYLDQGSRSGGQGTYNFVVFDDSLPKILGHE